MASKAEEAEAEPRPLCCWRPRTERAAAEIVMLHATSWCRAMHQYPPASGQDHYSSYAYLSINSRSISFATSLPHRVSGRSQSLGYWPKQGLFKGFENTWLLGTKLSRLVFSLLQQ